MHSVRMPKATANTAGPSCRTSSLTPASSSSMYAAIRQTASTGVGVSVAVTVASSSASAGRARRAAPRPARRRPRPRSWSRALPPVPLQCGGQPAALAAVAAQALGDVVARLGATAVGSADDVPAGQRVVLAAGVQAPRTPWLPSDALAGQPWMLAGPDRARPSSPWAWRTDLRSVQGFPQARRGPVVVTSRTRVGPVLRPVVSRGCGPVVASGTAQRRGCVGLWVDLVSLVVDAVDRAGGSGGGGEPPDVRCGVLSRRRRGHGVALVPKY